MSLLYSSRVRSASVGPLEVGREHGAGVLAGALGDGHDVGADVAACVARTDQGLEIETANRRAQAVPGFLDPPAERRIFEDKPDIVLDHAQALAGAVGRGVEHATEIDGFARVVQFERGNLTGAGPTVRLPRRPALSGGRSGP